MIAFLAAAVLAVLPNPLTTPGALNPHVTQANIHRTICRKGWTATIRPPNHYTRALKRQQLSALGLNIDPRSVEEDHRVPLELGGAPANPKNLYPETWGGPYGALAKDSLETAAKLRVCRLEITLAQGQAIFLGDWTMTYDEWFGAPSSK